MIALTGAASYWRPQNVTVRDVEGVRHVTK